MYGEPIKVLDDGVFINDDQVQENTEEMNVEEFIEEAEEAEEVDGTEDTEGTGDAATGVLSGESTAKDVANDTGAEDVPKADVYPDMADGAEVKKAPRARGRKAKATEAGNDQADQADQADRKSSVEASEPVHESARKVPIQSSVWVEVYSSRQNRSILKWPVVAIEQHAVRNGQEQVLCLAVGKNQLKGYISFDDSGIKSSGSVSTDRIRALKYIGQEIAFVVTGIVYDEGFFVASRKLALARLSGRVWPSLKEGMVVHAVARKVYDKNVIVEFDGIEARLPIGEISYGWVDEMADHVQPGDEFDVKVIRVDRENERVIVSKKALIPNPWPGAMDRYQKNGIYLGKVSGVVTFGVFVELEPGVNALCNHLRTTSKYQAQEGDMVAVQVSSVSYENGEGRVRGGVIRIVRKAS